MDKKDTKETYLLSKRETEEYDRLKKSGQYTDDAVMRLRAMMNVGDRDRSVVKDMAWALRERRDRKLSEDLARTHGGPAGQYYVPTTVADVRRAGSATMDGVEMVGEAHNADLRGLFDEGKGVEARRKALYLSRRWGLSLNDGWSYTGTERVEKFAKPGGWIETGQTGVEIRPIGGFKLPGLTTAVTGVRERRRYPDGSIVTTVAGGQGKSKYQAGDRYVLHRNTGAFTRAPQLGRRAKKPAGPGFMRVPFRQWEKDTSKPDPPWMRLLMM